MRIKQCWEIFINSGHKPFGIICDKFLCQIIDLNHKKTDNNYRWENSVVARGMSI